MASRARRAIIDKIIEEGLKDAPRMHRTPQPYIPPPVHIDRPFNGYRTANSDAARVLVSEATAALEEYERTRLYRIRCRRLDDQVAFERQVEAIVCDLAHRMITSPNNWIAVTFSKQVLGHKQRYRAPVLTGTFPDLVTTMATPELTYAEYVVGYKPFFYSPHADRKRMPNVNFVMPTEGRQTVIRAGKLLQDRIFALGLSVHDFGLEKSEEVIILKSAKDTYFDKTKPLRYQDSPETNTMREQVWRINDWLEKADIAYVGHPDESIDVTDRRLRRIFNNGNFDEGGRLYGGFWQQMSKKLRHGILLEGNNTVVLDYGQMVPRILYGLAGCTPHFNDAYTIPGLEQHREGVKIIFNSMLHLEKPLARFPKDSKDLFPKGIQITNISHQIISFHSPIAAAFQSGRGMYYSKVESEILIAVLEELIGLGIPALPIHDAVVVRHDHEETVTTIMKSVFKNLTGIEAIVERDD